ncbi:MAG: hypothetical protein QN720_10160, partial [Nitrososphaeraceae archaeon]|nr:hypothetical protein [Nitrososphaeraceae archaeon]
GLVIVCGKDSIDVTCCFDFKSPDSSGLSGCSSCSVVVGVIADSIDESLFSDRGFKDISSSDPDSDST